MGERTDSMSTNSRDAILEAARRGAQAHGYTGISFRDLAKIVGIKAASIYHYFPTKAELGVAVARRYWEQTASDLEQLLADEGSPTAALVKYPSIFRRSLENENRLCMVSFMAAEFDDLPEEVREEVQKFADVNVAWLSDMLAAAGLASADESVDRGRAIYAAVAGAQLLARSRSDITLFDTLISSYRAAGLLPH